MAKTIENLEEKIIGMLREKQYITAKEFAGILGVSEKTIRQKIKSINDFISSYQAEIKVQYGKGYYLVTRDPEEFDKLFWNGRMTGASMYGLSENRVEYIINYVLLIRKKMNLLDLCETLNVSESTLANDIRAARSLLNKYGLDLKTERKNGVSLIGNEFNIRVCMADYIDSGRLLEGELLKYVNEYKDLIPSVMLDKFAKYSVFMPELSFNSVVNYITVTMIRAYYKDYVNIDKEKDTDEITLKVAKEIFDEISNYYDIEFPESEVITLAYYMIARRLDRSSHLYNIVVPPHIMVLANEVLTFIYQTMNIDFRNNFLLIMNLSIHFLSMMIRLKYNMNTVNPLKSDIYKKYPLGITLAKQAATVISRHYEVEVNEDEIGLLALIFEVSLQKNYEVRKKNILIVCATGKASSELLAHQYRQLFGQYLDEIRICNAQEIKNQDFNHIDYVITTVPLYEPICVPIIETRFFLNEEDVKTIFSVLNRDNDLSMSKYYRQELFFNNVSFDTKDEVLQYMCREISKKLNIKEDLLTSIRSREELGPTDFGELIAMPHTIDRFNGTSFIAVCILDKPVFWATHEVQAVFMMSITEGDDEDLQDFYSKTSDLMLSREKAKILIRNRDYETLIKLLNE